MRELHKKYTTK
uniref:Uncharacterized protein n=1 Tax=Anguilla anguilla TaxID=7936 RepID=A0A0E9VF66_ANGAN